MKQHDLVTGLLAAKTLKETCAILLQLAHEHHSKKSAMSAQYAEAVCDRIEWHFWRPIALADNTTSVEWLQRTRRVFGMLRDQLSSQGFVGDSLCTFLESHVKGEPIEVDEGGVPVYWPFNFGAARAQEWEGVAIPEFRSNYVTLFVQPAKANRVPVAYREGMIECVTITDPTVDKDCLDLVYLIAGTESESNAGYDESCKHAQETVNAFGADKFHFANRRLNSDHVIFAGKNVPRFILIRIYLNSDFECIEQPEMLLGCPLGQYHCPECGAMQIAGVPHLAEV